VTLPLIYLHEISPGLFRSLPCNIEKVSSRISQKVCGYLEKAEGSLNIVPDSVYKQSLERLLQRFQSSIPISCSK